MTCVTRCATAVHGQQQTDCDSAPKQDRIFRLIKDDTVVCAPSDDYVTGCLLTRGGSKMLGMHQAMTGKSGHQSSEE